MNERKTFEGVGDIKYLTPDNCRFEVSENGFVKASIEGAEAVRVYLYRAFPHDMSDKYISVTDSEKIEYGIIRDLSIFGEETAKIVLADLDRRYFIPKILEITALEEKFGNSYWSIVTDVGERIITVKDTFRSIIRIGDDRAMVSDEDGNRYEIVSLEGLDRKSYRRIELFL